MLSRKKNAHMYNYKPMLARNEMWVKILSVGKKKTQKKIHKTICTDKDDLSTIVDDIEDDDYVVVVECENDKTVNATQRAKTTRIKFCFALDSLAQWFVTSWLYHIAEHDDFNVTLFFVKLPNDITKCVKWRDYTQIVCTALETSSEFRNVFFKKLDESVWDRLFSNEYGHDWKSDRSVRDYQVRILLNGFNTEQPKYTFEALQTFHVLPVSPQSKSLYSMFNWLVPKMKTQTILPRVQHTTIITRSEKGVNYVIDFPQFNEFCYSTDNNYTFWFRCTGNGIEARKIRQSFVNSQLKIGQLNNALLEIPTGHKYKVLTFKHNETYRMFWKLKMSLVNICANIYALFRRGTHYYCVERTGVQFSPESLNIKEKLTEFFYKCARQQYIVLDLKYSEMIEIDNDLFAKHVEVATADPVHRQPNLKEYFFLNGLSFASLEINANLMSKWFRMPDDSLLRYVSKVSFSHLHSHDDDTTDISNDLQQIVQEGRNNLYSPSLSVTQHI